jgi:beta-carotene 15,15'-dioxygenase
MRKSWLPTQLLIANWPVALALLLVVLKSIDSRIVDSITLPLLVIGMIFPGIPHGAVDHELKLANHPVRSLPLFVIRYLGIMLVIVLVWYVAPFAGLFLFLAYSAWHFGETDTREWNIYRPLYAILQGAGMLSFLLLSHPVDLVQYLQLLGMPNVHIGQQVSLWISTMAAAILLLFGLVIPSSKRSSWLRTILVLLAGVFLPLIPAFGLYFICIHSATGWGHIKNKLRLNNAQLLRLAMPFSLGAFALFALLILVDQWIGLSFDGFIPAIFVFLAAVSAPHIWYMHRFYQE